MQQNKFSMIWESNATYPHFIRSNAAVHLLYNYIRRIDALFERNINTCFENTVNRLKLAAPRDLREGTGRPVVRARFIVVLHCLSAFGYLSNVLATTLLTGNLQEIRNLHMEEEFGYAELLQFINWQLKTNIAPIDIGDGLKYRFDFRTSVTVDRFSSLCTCLYQCFPGWNENLTQQTIDTSNRYAGKLFDVINQISKNMLCMIGRATNHLETSHDLKKIMAKDDRMRNYIIYLNGPIPK